jgi:hypothetical protein
MMGPQEGEAKLWTELYQVMPNYTLLLDKAKEVTTFNVTNAFDVLDNGGDITEAIIPRKGEERPTLNKMDEKKTEKKHFWVSRGLLTSKKKVMNYNVPYMNNKFKSINYTTLLSSNTRGNNFMTKKTFRVMIKNFIRVRFAKTGEENIYDIAQIMMTVVKDGMELNKDLHDVIVEELFQHRYDENGTGSMMQYYLNVFAQG